MKTLTEIAEIIANLPDDLFNRLNDNDYLFELDPRERRNSKRRFDRALAKAGLTEIEWFMWEAN